MILYECTVKCVHRTPAVFYISKQSSVNVFNIRIGQTPGNSQGNSHYIKQTKKLNIVVLTEREAINQNHSGIFKQGRKVLRDPKEPIDA